MLDIRPLPGEDPWTDWSDEVLDALDFEPSDQHDDGLSDLPTGVFLALGVAQLDFDTLPADRRVEAVTALQRLVSHYQAKLYDGVASIYAYLEDDFDGDVEMATGATAAEIRAALRLTRRCADITVDLALTLASRLPAVHEAFSAGRLDSARVKTIVSGTEHLTADTARRVVERVLADAPRLTTGQLAARLRRLCLEVDPDDAADRLDSAHQERRVELRADPAGTGHLFAYDLDPVRAAQAMDRVDRLARSVNVAGEGRTIDQLRADVFLDLLCGADTDATGTTHITVDLDTLMELADKPGELGGFGPLVAELTREATAASRRWEYSIRDGDTGDVIAAGTTRRRPTAATRRAVRASSLTCVFPGCRIPAVDCDVDHIEDYATGGPTVADNLAPACRHDHRIKHRYGWIYRRLPGGGYEWISRLGLVHRTVPP